MTRITPPAWALKAAQQALDVVSELIDKPPREVTQETLLAAMAEAIAREHRRTRKPSRWER